MNSSSDIAKKIAYKVKEAGGNVYYVGGFVRDRIQGIESKDVDIEVHGISVAELREILESLGTPLTFGDSFGVFSLAGYDIDIALPRVEHATGRGHRDFEVSVDPFIGTYRAALRRDFTMNALMEDVLTGEITDHFGGLNDIKNRVIRHIDEITFTEDPLRVLRACQFAARFGFTISDSTVELCKTIDISTLSRERIEGELKKVLLKSERPSVFFEYLRKMNQLDVWFKELIPLIGLEQDAVFHPEGDAYIHTMQVLDRAAAFRAKSENPYSFMLLALTHDFGKAVTTETVNGRIHSYAHEEKGIPIVSEFLSRITGEKAVKSYVLNMVSNHMRPNMLAYSNSSVKSSNRMFDEVVSPRDLVYFALCDKTKTGSAEDKYAEKYLYDRLEIFDEIMQRPYVTGKDLIDSGLIPSDNFSEILSYAHKLRLAGISKDEALKQTLRYAEKL
ncbi:MAG: CCA tRNA nucleotidyltransferase [Clostridia bacterium]|nr:CCA tRNA nucleotidyltransferase [Clostridia bacterium]